MQQAIRCDLATTSHGEWQDLHARRQGRSPGPVNQHRGQEGGEEEEKQSGEGEEWNRHGSEEKDRSRSRREWDQWQWCYRYPFPLPSLNPPSLVHLDLHQLFSLRRPSGVLCSAAARNSPSRMQHATSWCFAIFMQGVR